MKAHVDFSCASFYKHFMGKVYKVGAIITVNDRMQWDYAYELVAPMGKQFAPGFTPFFTPKQMLEQGVFEGKYCNDCRDELPADWFTSAKISDVPNVALNCFGIKSRQPLSVWLEKGYYLGRRLPQVDTIQIKRWRAFTRHAAQIKAHCEPLNMACRPRQRQALLQWAYDPFI
jgi:hypothetical protein